MLQSKLSNANQSDSDRNKSSVKTEGKELQDAPFPFLIYKPGKLYYACLEQKGNYEWQKERKQFTSVRIVGMRKRSGSVSVQCVRNGIHLSRRGLTVAHERNDCSARR